MRTPKEIFLTCGHAEAFKKMVGTDAFESACQFALMQLRTELPPNVSPGAVVDPLIGFDSNAQMEGAARVISILHTLPHPAQTRTPPKRDTLNYATPT